MFTQILKIMGQTKKNEEPLCVGQLVFYYNLLGRISDVMKCSDGRCLYRIGCFPMYIEGKHLSDAGCVDVIGVEKGRRIKL